MYVGRENLLSLNVTTRELHTYLSLALKVAVAVVVVVLHQLHWQSSNRRVERWELFGLAWNRSVFCIDELIKCPISLRKQQ